jgi:glycosyltransferase involved in cell wall biosynthesis
VPLYNKASTIERTLQSIQLQKMQDWEAIVVNDGSTDDGPQRVRDFIARTGDQRFRLLDQPNAGPGAARNRGIRESQGDYVAFLDGDDEWGPEFLSRSLELLGRDARLGAVSCCWFDEPGHISSVDWMRREGLQSGSYEVTPEMPLERFALLVVLMSPCSTVARREAIERLGGFREQRCRYGEDAFLWVQVLLNYPVYMLLEEHAVFHRNLSELSGNYKGARPLEPFLDDPEAVRRSCPPHLSTQLERWLALRAMKSACMLAYWGQWRQAAKLRRRFPVSAPWTLPWFWTSLLVSNPLGSVAGAIARGLRR